MRTSFYTAVFHEIPLKISRKTSQPFWYWGLENMTTYDFYLFHFYFNIKVFLTLSSNLAKSTCSFYWCYVFSFVTIFIKNFHTERKTHSTAIGEEEYLQENTCFGVWVGVLHPWTFLKSESNIDVFLWISET